MRRCCRCEPAGGARRSAPRAPPLPDALDEAHRRAGRARALLLVYVAVVALQLLGGVVVELFAPYAANAALVSFDRVALALQVLVFVACVVTFVRWKVAAYRLLPGLTGTDTNYTPSWAGWAYVVPFINLVRPHTIMRELWEGSEPARVDLEREPAGRWPLGVWWGCWLLGGLAGRVARSLERNGASLDDGALIALGLSSVLLLVTAAACAAFLVGRIDGRMRRRGTEVLSAAVHPAGPPLLLF